MGIYGPQFISLARPPAGVYLDFVQEWLSARNALAGDPIYLPQREGLRRRTGVDEPDFDREMRWNAHPPVAVLVALPFGLISDYRTAHLAWTLATLPAFPLQRAGRRTRTGDLRLVWWGVLPLPGADVDVFPGDDADRAGTVELRASARYSLRGGRRTGAVTRSLAGLAVGLATAVKLFPGFVFVYFLFARRWRAVAAGALTCAAANGLAVAMFGVEAFTTYVREVVPSLEGVPHVVAERLSHGVLVSPPRPA